MIFLQRHLINPCSTYQAFLALTEARKEVERRQTRLLDLCESTEACLNMMSDKDYALLELGVKNLRNQLAYHKQRLGREKYVVLVLGWFLKKFLKARNYVEVEACARVEA